jgi:hypothetical protein
MGINNDIHTTINKGITMSSIRTDVAQLKLVERVQNSLTYYDFFQWITQAQSVTRVSGRIYVVKSDKILWVEPFHPYIIRYVSTLEIERVFSRNHVSFNTTYPDVFLTSDAPQSHRIQTDLIDRILPSPGT